MSMKFLLIILVLILVMIFILAMPWGEPVRKGPPVNVYELGNIDIYIWNTLA